MNGKEVMKRIYKIAITGPESTGKSTLSESLAMHYQTLWVPEFARDYLAHLKRPYTLSDITKIAMGQRQLEKSYEKKMKSGFLFCDTDYIVTKIWAEHAFGECPEWIETQIRKNCYDLYFLCNIDIPWEDDPLREHPHLRSHFFNAYKTELERRGFPYHIISGNQEQRIISAQKHLKVLD